MILLDASGSMSGKSFELAITTVSAILDTLSDNDFVNLIAFSDKTRSVVPCFKDKMVISTLLFDFLWTITEEKNDCCIPFYRFVPMLITSRK